jgi:hypothetical protein
MRGTKGLRLPSRAPDERGNRYGKLVVIERAANRIIGRCTVAFWICRCDCGNRTEVAGRALRHKDKPIRSCGCIGNAIIHKPAHVVQCSICGEEFLVGSSQYGNLLLAGAKPACSKEECKKERSRRHLRALRAAKPERSREWERVAREKVYNDPSKHQEKLRKHKIYDYQIRYGDFGLAASTLNDLLIELRSIIGATNENECNNDNNDKRNAGSYA